MLLAFFRHHRQWLGLTCERSVMSAQPRILKFEAQVLAAHPEGVSELECVAGDEQLRACAVLCGCLLPGLLILACLVLRWLVIFQRFFPAQVSQCSR